MFDLGFVIHSTLGRALAHMGSDSPTAPRDIPGTSVLSLQDLPAIQDSPLSTAVVGRSSPAPLSPVYKGTLVSPDNNFMSSDRASPCLESSLGASPVPERFSTPFPHDFVEPNVFDGDGGPRSPARSPLPLPDRAPESPHCEPKKKKQTTVAPTSSRHSGAFIRRARLPLPSEPMREQQKIMDVRNKPAPSQPSGRFVYHSPTKVVVPIPSRSSRSISKPAPSTCPPSPCPAPSRSSSSTYYSPENVRKNMGAHGIESMYLEDKEEILAFFEKLLEDLKERVQTRDKNDKGPLLFKGVLQDWVIDHAIGPIPSKERILLLDPKVSHHILFLFKLFLIQ
jgi:hypothetical protein